MATDVAQSLSSTVERYTKAIGFMAQAVVVQQIGDLLHHRGCVGQRQRSPPQGSFDRDALFFRDFAHGILPRNSLGRDPPKRLPSLRLARHDL